VSIFARGEKGNRRSHGPTLRDQQFKREKYNQKKISQPRKKGTKTFIGAWLSAEGRDNDPWNDFCRYKLKKSSYRTGTEHIPRPRTTIKRKTFSAEFLEQKREKRRLRRLAA